MQINEVKNCVHKFIEKALKQFQRSLDRGMIKPPEGTKFVFPTILLLTETPDAIIYELTGASNRFVDLKRIDQHCPSNALYFGQFTEHDAEAYDVSRWNNIVDSTIRGTGFFSSDDKQKSLSRFPFLSNSLNTGLFANANRGIYIGERVHRVVISDVTIVNQHDGELRAKYINHCGILGNFCRKDDAKNHIQSQCYQSAPPGVLLLSKLKAERMLVAAQFTSLFLSPFVHEPKLGMFLKQNPTFLKKALCTDHFISEQTFRWQKPYEKESPIRPDILIRRPDNTYDIYDLKTALLSKNVTRKNRARRMLAPDLEEGIAQLAHYNEYFLTSENINYVKDTHNIQVNNPRLVLIAGNQTNTKPHELREALRKVNLTEDRFDVISYDALVLAFLNAPD